MNTTPLFSENSRCLNRIANHLLLHASYTPDLGLYHGKMGIVLFFAHYARYTGNPSYDDFSGDLLDELYAELHADMGVDLETGLCGIGWGIGFLLLHDFMDGNPDEILTDLDQIIMKRDIRRVDDFSLETGLAGISCYVRMRLELARRFSLPLPFDDIFLSDWKKAAGNEVESPNENLKSWVAKNRFDSTSDIKEWKLGLVDGCAGYGLKMMGI